MLETLCMSGMSPRTYAPRFPPGQNPDMAPGYCSPHTTPTLHPPRQLPAFGSALLLGGVGGGELAGALAQGMALM